MDAVVHTARQAACCRSADALRETLRRRRASGGPAEQTFATLIGLELRPRRLRDASRLWASLTDARGVDGRDGLWAHPDMLPTATDLDDPDGFVHREQLDFSELDKMLGEAAGKPDLKKKDDLKKDDLKKDEGARGEHRPDDRGEPEGDDGE
ncbi:Zinc-dependent metalloprotease OS=Streptomyces tendae OX=1932 GN=GUR47_14855 PE=4 SV=1 [Streptomyces tendae]